MSRRLLYVTFLWSSFEDLILKGAAYPPRGMPAFSYVLEELIKRGYIIDCIFYTNKKVNSKNAGVNHSIYRKINVIEIITLRQKSGIAKLFYRVADYFRMCKYVEKAMRTNRYDFVYGHGMIADAARHISHKYKVPFGQRVYGDFFWDIYKKRGFLLAILNDFSRYFTYRKQKEFLLITDDGTNGDKTSELIGGVRPKYKLCFWLNGVERQISQKDTSNFAFDKETIKAKKPFLLYVARVARWKGQIHAISILHNLKQRGIVVNLIYAGQLDDDKYFGEIMTEAVKFGVQNQISYIGALPQNAIRELSRLTVAALSFYDVSNLGNVFLELLSYGTIIISKNDGSLDRFIKSGENGFLVDDMVGAADIVVKLISDSNLVKSVRNNASSTSIEKLESWDLRVEKEIKLIESAINDWEY